MLQLSLLSAFKIEPYVRMHMCTSVRSYHQSFKPHDNRAAKCPSELTVTGISCAFCPDNNPIPNGVFPFEVSKEFFELEHGSNSNFSEQVLGDSGKENLSFDWQNR